MKIEKKIHLSNKYKQYQPFSNYEKVIHKNLNLTMHVTKSAVNFFSIRINIFCLSCMILSKTR